MKCRFATLVLVAACSSSNNHTTDAPGNGSGSNQGGSCSLTLSGGQTGTYSCTSTTAWASSNNEGAFSITPTGFSGMINIAVGWPGEPHTGTYQSTDANAKGGASVVTGSGASTMAWAAAVGGGNAPIGSYTLSFTSISNTVTTSNGKAYTGHGTFTATLASQTGQGTMIMMSATF